MRMEFHALNLPQSPALEEHASRRLLGAIQRFGGHVRQIIVRVSDDNGPRGGVDKRVLVEVRLAPHGRLMIDERDADPYRGIASASHALKRAMSKRFGRRRGRREDAWARGN